MRPASVDNASTDYASEDDRERERPFRKQRPKSRQFTSRLLLFGASGEINHDQ
jgi:hypothetical protein